MEYRTPVHLWIVGVLAVLWNAFGAFNYVMAQTRNDAMLASLSEAQRAYFEAFPAWANGAWAFGVWGGLAGSLLILARSRWAILFFALSIAGVAGTTLYQFILSSPPPEFTSAGSIGLHVFIWAVAIGLLLYANRMRDRGVLR